MHAHRTRTGCWAVAGDTRRHRGRTGGAGQGPGGQKLELGQKVLQVQMAFSQNSRFSAQTVKHCITNIYFLRQESQTFATLHGFPGAPLVRPAPRISAPLRCPKGTPGRSPSHTTCLTPHALADQDTGDSWHSAVFTQANPLAQCP